MPELGQVPACAALFSTERRCHRVEALEGWHRCFGVELPRLCQVGRASEIGHLEESAAAFYSASDEIRCLIFDEIPVAEIRVNGAENRRAHLQHRRHSARSEVEVTVIEEEFGLAALGFCHR